MGVGLGISLGFAVIIIIMTLWHLINKDRMRRRQRRLMAQFNYASDEPAKPGVQSGRTFRHEAVELLGVKGGAFAITQTPSTTVYSSPPETTPPSSPEDSLEHSPQDSPEHSPTTQESPRGRPLHRRFYGGQGAAHDATRGPEQG